MKKIVLVLLVLANTLIINAQTVSEIQQKYINALGGKAVLAKLKNMYQESTMEVAGMQMNAKMWVVYGIAMRQEVDMMGQKMITFVGTDKGWMINPLMGSSTPQPLPVEALKEYLGVLTPGGELNLLAEKGFTSSVVGKEDVNGKPAYKIKLTKDSIESYLFVDVATNYLVKTSTSTSVAGEPIEIKTQFTDYKKTPEGFVFPYTSIISNPMMGDIKLTTTKLEVNKPVDVKKLEQSDSSAIAGGL